MIRIRASRYGHSKQAVVDHAKEDIAILTIIMASILASDRKWILERQGSCVEADSVIGKIALSLGIVPLRARHLP
jgi:hypothetical protein